jgi:hypothetical protein
VTGAGLVRGYAAALRRLRWLVIAGWIAAAVLAYQHLPIKRLARHEAASAAPAAGRGR